MEALDLLGLESLQTRRLRLALTFGKKCTKNTKTRDLFPENDQIQNYLRKREKYKVKFGNNKRLQDSSVPTIQRMLNENH